MKIEGGRVSYALPVTIDTGAWPCVLVTTHLPGHRTARVSLASLVVSCSECHDFDGLSSLVSGLSALPYYLANQKGSQ
jgi:hypothetical protein